LFRRGRLWERKGKKGGKSDGRKDSPEITGGLFFLIMHRKDLEVNELDPNLVYDRTLWRNLIHVGDPT